MRKIPVFIASSITEFDYERRELVKFLNVLNDVYKNSGVKLVWDGPENMSRAIVRGGAQLPYDEKIRNCRFFILLIGQKIGEYTAREFHLALEQFAVTDSPKIFPYFYAKNGRELPPEVVAFRDEMRRRQDYYTQTYTSLDQIKRALQIDLERNGAFEVKSWIAKAWEYFLFKFTRKSAWEIQNERKKIQWLHKQNPSERIVVEITKSYEQMTRFVKKSKLETDALLDYMEFLWKQHLHDRGIELGRWLENFGDVTIELTL